MSYFNKTVTKAARGFSARSMTSELDQAQLQLAEYRICLQKHHRLARMPLGTVLYAFTSGRAKSYPGSNRYVRFVQTKVRT